MGERWLCKPEVVGSIPISSTIQDFHPLRAGVGGASRLCSLTTESAQSQTSSLQRATSWWIVSSKGSKRKRGARGSTLESRARLEACLRDKAKLQRAYGGCLGSQRRRRTWIAAISSGEPLTGPDPEISEWGNPTGECPSALGEYITERGQPRELKHLSTWRNRKRHRFRQ